MYQQDPLPRRLFLGLRVSTRPRHASEPARGLRVESVLADGAAEIAGLMREDTLLAIDDRLVHSARDLVDAARSQRHAARMTFRFLRGGDEREASVVAPRIPSERIEGGFVELDSVLGYGGARLRTITTVPDSPGTHPALMFLQGIRPTSCEFPLEPDHPTLRLVAGWTKGGFVVQRVERSGVGDSDGPSPARTDLGAELDGYDAGLEALFARSDVDRNRVFLFGHSFGGMLSPLVALERSLAGVIVFGSSSARWHECVVATSRRRLELTRPSDPRLARRLELWEELHALVCRGGRTPADLFGARPDLRELRSHDCEGDTLYGRQVALVRELDGLDLRAAWGALGREGSRVLALHGEFDWICSSKDAADIAADSGPHAEHREIDRMGHDMLLHGSQQAAFEDPRSGTWDPRLVMDTVAWMRARG